MDKKFIIILLMIIMLGSLWGTLVPGVFKKVDTPIDDLKEGGIYVIVAKDTHGSNLAMEAMTSTPNRINSKHVTVYDVSGIDTIDLDVLINIDTKTIAGSGPNDHHLRVWLIEPNGSGYTIRSFENQPRYLTGGLTSSNLSLGTPVNTNRVWAASVVTHQQDDHLIMRSLSTTDLRSISYHALNTHFSNDPYDYITHLPISLYKLVVDDSPLSVTLSSFSASLIANNAVNLSWTTSSESNLRGFEIMRSENSNISDAQRIPHNSINGTNTSQHHSYRFIDYDVVIGMEYFYWLRMIMNDNSITYSEPVDVKVFEAITTPPSPLFTAVQSVYPNPLRTGTSSTFELAVKDNETAVLRIFNIRGQLVREFEPRKTGNHKINWNMRGSDNRVVGTGVYFYQLTSESVETVHRMVIIK